MCVYIYTYMSAGRKKNGKVKIKALREPWQYREAGRTVCAQCPLPQCISQHKGFGREDARDLLVSS